MQLTIGCDPEIFLRKAGNFMSAYGGVFKGTKDKPEKVRQGAVQVDGMALEFNTDPASTVQEFSSNIETVLQQIRDKLDEDVEFDTSCTVRFDGDSLFDHPLEARIMGCDPDYNAYTMQANPQPDEDAPMRTAGGHVHIGWGEGMDSHEEDCSLVIKMCDVFLGIPSVVLDRDVERRSLYGKAGAFRAKPYGTEYRTLSNFWVHSKELREWVFHQSSTAFENALNVENIYKSIGCTAEDVQRVINTSDVETAQHIIDKLGIRMPSQ